MSVRELLLEFSRQTLLNFVEAWKEWDGNKDDDCFFAMADFELTG